MISILLLKVVVLGTLLVLTFLFSVLPLKFARSVRHQVDHNRRRRCRHWISLLSCFAAGVFLSTCLLDLLPQVRDKLRSAMDDLNMPTAFPVSEFVLSIGLFLVLIIEQLVLMVQERNTDGYSPIHAPESRDRLVGHSSHHQEDRRSRESRPGSTGHDEGRYIDRLSGSSSDEDDAADDEHSGAGHSHDHLHHKHTDPSSHSYIRSLFLLLALSMHSIFEGLAVGLQGDVKNILQIFAALTIHKCILAFSLGLNFVQSHMTVRGILRSGFLFAITSPIGISIGIIVFQFTVNPVMSNLVCGLLEGIACGTFLFVVFFEILPHEFNTKARLPNRMLKLLFLLVGYAAISLLLFLSTMGEPGPVKPMPTNGTNVLHMEDII
ncbi:Zinc transporter ZIP1 [Lamellibrachia satsuma]|nr:Zinc transporter ZIP1 [Lamellibrachia satsuma]